MAESNSPRFGVRRWGAGTDTFSRAELDASMAAIELLAAQYGQGIRSARPASAITGRFYTVVGDALPANNGLVFYDTGAGWITLGLVTEASTVRSPALGTVVQTVVGFAGQTADLTRWTDSAGVVLAKVTKDGNAVFVDVVMDDLTADAVDAQALTAVSGIIATLTATDFRATTFRSNATRLDGTPKTNITIAGAARMDGLIPPGVIVMYTGITAPNSEWYMCNGADYDRTAEPDMFAATSTRYGSISGTSFKVPNFQAKFPLGASGAGAYALGASGGEENHILTIAEMPAHTHPGSSITPNVAGWQHSHSDVTLMLQGGPTPIGLASWAVNETTAHGHAITVVSQGGGTAHNNMPSFQTVNFIIKR